MCWRTGECGYVQSVIGCVFSFAEASAPLLGIAVLLSRPYPDSSPPLGVDPVTFDPQRLTHLIARARALEDYEQEHQRMVAMHVLLTEELTQTTEENERLKVAIALAIEEGRRRDAFVLKNKELQSARHFDKIASNIKLRQQWHEHLLIVEEVN